MNQQILKVLHYIENHLDDELNIDTLSKVAGYSSYYFCRIFKISVGESVMSYSSRLRVKKASSHIINSEKSIIQIALDVGFETPNGFNKAFKKIFNVTPTEYRKKHLQLLITLKDERMKEPKLVQRETTYVVYNTAFGAYELSAKKAWEELIQKLEPNKRVSILNDSELFGICHSDPETTLPQDIQYDAAISCNKEEMQAFKEKGFLVKVIEEGTFATVTYGKEIEANKAWLDLFSWIVEQDLSLECKNTPPFEKYLNWSVDIKEEDLIKEIYIPLK